MNIVFLCSPEVIIIGGGVMNRTILYDIARSEFKKIINKYLEHEKFDSLITILFNCFKRIVYMRTKIQRSSWIDRRINADKFKTKVKVSKTI